jgi:tripartite ATP-independent transporter DctP family solute receptor
MSNRLLIAASMLSTISTVSAMEFRSADVHPDGYPTVEAVKFMAENLARSTKGRLSIKVSSSGALGGERDALEQIRVGALDMTRVNVAVLNDYCPASIVPTLPYVFRSVEHMRRVVDGPIGAERLQSCEAQGIVGLAFYDSGSRSIYGVGKPVRTLADMRGIRLRVQQSAMWISMAQSLGATPVVLAFNEVVPALKAGAIDAAENNLPTFESTGAISVATYYARTEHTINPDVVLFSKKVWSKLSAEDKAALRKAAKESVGRMRTLWEAREHQATQAIKSAGGEIVEVDRSAFRVAVSPLYARFLNEPWLLNLLKRIQDTK